MSLPPVLADNPIRFYAARRQNTTGIGLTHRIDKGELLDHGYAQVLPHPATYSRPTFFVARSHKQRHFVSTLPVQKLHRQDWPDCQSGPDCRMGVLATAPFRLR